MEKFFEELQAKIVKAVKKDFPAIKQQMGTETPYAVAFETDSDYITLWLGVNTLEALERTRAKYAKDGDNNYYDDDYKWNPDEWGYSDGGNYLAKVSDEIAEKVDAVIEKIESKFSDLSFEEYQEQFEQSGFPQSFIETVTAAFKELIDSGFFGFDNQKMTYFITMSDDEKSVKIENDSAKALSSNERYEQFANRHTYY